MLEVALSRRMCCSRVCSASRYAGRPSASTETPTSRPGRCRSRPAADGHEAGVRAAVEQRDAEALARSRPRRRRPSAPGDSSRVSASRSAATTASAPRSWAASITGRGSRTRPDAPGYCTSTPHSSPSGRPSVEVGDDAPRCPSPRRGCAPPRWSAAARRRRPRTGRPPCLLRAAYQRHRLGGGGALVEQRGVGGRQAGQVADHRLEVEQRLEPALARSPAGTACRRCTRSGPRARCAGSPAG